MLKAERISWCRLCKPAVRKLDDSRGKILPGQSICQPVAGRPYVHTACVNKIVKDEVRDEWMLAQWRKEQESCYCVKCGNNRVSEKYDTCDACFME